MDVLTAHALRERHRVVRSAGSAALATRLHRAISWLHCAEASVADIDTRFIFLWIAFNAAYAGDFGESSEREQVADFLHRAVESDAGGRLHAALFEQFCGPIRTLLENRYVFEPFWRALREHDSSERWKSKLEASNKVAMKAVLDRRTNVLLGIVLDRLYVLRNQLVHGGATWNSSINRSQLRDGCAILGSVVPTVISIMLDGDGFDIGPVAYPPLPAFDLSTQIT